MTKPQLNWYFLFYVVLFGFLAWLLARPINLTNQDIGRHLANGREIIAGNFQVLTRNYYSFTEPERRFINHHWLFGLIFYGIEQVSGFVGVHLVHIALLLLAYGIFLKIIKIKLNNSDFLTLFLALPATLFIALRSEVRPESLGLLFLIFMLYRLQEIIRTKQLSSITIVGLWLMQLLWINTHISFIFGLFMPTLLLLCSFVLKSPQLSTQLNKKLLKFTLGLVFVSLLNPNFIMGLLQPLTIFTDYGYSVFENQTLWFLWRVVGHTTLFNYLIMAGATLTLLISRGFWLNKFELLLCLFGLGMGYLALRNIPLSIVFVWPAWATIIGKWHQSSSLVNKYQISLKQKLIFLGQFYLLFIILSLAGVLVPFINWHNRHIGLLPNQAQAAEFVKDNQLTGPIFNNYDLGSYLIYYLPEIKVFTDNRPEAYGKQFFQEIYIPMQQNPELWEQKVEEYQLQTIIFGTLDITNWAREFLRYIVTDENWENVYQDEMIGIWVRRQETQQPF